MREVSGPILLEENPLRIQVRDLRLLVEQPSWLGVFFGNLRYFFFPPKLPPLELRSAPAPFWTDVFVKRGLPWRRFLESGGYHTMALALLLGVSRLIAMQPQPAPPSNFDHTQVIYYQPAEYLPPLDTRSDDTARPAKADPEFSRQPIISVPREADNHSQTIVTPPNIKLQRDVPLPNIVAWSDRPRLPVAPAPLVPASSVTRLTPQLERVVVAPPPDPTRDLHHRDLNTMETSVVAPPPDLAASPRTAFQAPQPAVVEPPPSVENASTRAIGDINVGHTSVIAPAPQLVVSEQRAIPGGASGIPGAAPQVVPPPPSFQGSGSSAGGRVIALNLHPAVGAPPDPPQGNRRGSFAATPEGHPGASGNAGAAAGSASGTDGNGSGKENGSGSGPNGTSDLPAGLYVGHAATPSKTSPVAGDPTARNSLPANSVNPNLIASVRPPRVTSIPARPLQPESETKLSEAEREVFGSRKFYSLTLNMPNLNSAGGSWVIRFAELKQDSNSNSTDLSAPAATRKVDPAYPLQIMRENVSGMVILYAVIHADGSVGNVRVLRSVDDRLDRFASEAIAKWQFQPAMKNGAPIDVEATFQIPFRPGRPGF
jgi:TonB family protein